jgi:predicted component of type VI protein secretion system
MPKLVVLSEGYRECSFELKTGEKTTVGRLEDNTFQIPEPSVSSHHCEVSLRGNELLIKDLNSTNGTFINDDRVTQGVLKSGQVMRLGQVEVRLEDENTPPLPANTSTSTATASTAVPAAKKTGVMPAVQAGVRLNDLEKGANTLKIDVNPAFKKKNNKINQVFIGIGLVLGLIIVALLIYAVFGPGSGGS